MADDNATLVSTLQERIKDLNEESARHRKERNEARTERDTLAKQVGDLTADRDSWKGKAESSHPELTKRVGDLQTKLANNTYKSSFRDAAIKAGINPDAVDAAWRLAEYKPAYSDDGAVDALVIDDLVSKSKEAHGYLYAPPEASNGSVDKTPKTPARLEVPHGLGGGGGNGGTRQMVNNPKILRLTPEQYGNSTWMSENRAMVAEANKAGLLEIA